MHARTRAHAHAHKHRRGIATPHHRHKVCKTHFSCECAVFLSLTLPPATWIPSVSRRRLINSFARLPPVPSADALCVRSVSLPAGRLAHSGCPFAFFVILSVSPSLPSPPRSSFSPSTRSLSSAQWLTAGLRRGWNFGHFSQSFFPFCFSNPPHHHHHHLSVQFLLASLPCVSLLLLLPRCKGQRGDL